MSLSNAIENIDNVKHTNTKKNYYGIDITKFIVSLLVVAIHVNPLSSYGKIIDFSLTMVVARIGVPFFFVASGYFLANKDISNLFTAFNYLKRVLLLYILWTIIYLPITIGLWIDNGNNISTNIKILIRDFFLTGSYNQFWYFAALLFCVALFAILRQFISTKKIMIISSILYIIGVFGDSYHGLAERIDIFDDWYDRYFKIFITTRNGLFFGLCFITLGVLLNENRNNTSITKRKSFLGFLLSLGLMFIEACLLKKYGSAPDFNMYFSLVPATLFLFLFLQNVSLRGNSVYSLLRKCSVLIFCSHLFINYYFVLFADVYNYECLITNSLLHYTSIVFLSMVFSLFVLKMEKIYLFKYLRYLY